MSTPEELKAQARANARTLLAQSQSFREMGHAEQMATYKSVVNDQYQNLKQQGMAMELRASDQINDRRHQNQRIDQVGQTGADFINDVDFPNFVEDLLEGVFDANLNVTLKQMESYRELMQAATASVSQFIRQISDSDAYSYLAENQSDNFSLTLPDEGGNIPVLANANGEPVDLGNNEVKARILDAKLAMAKEQRALLRETLLMGVSRLVVEKGTVKAAVVFDVKASEKVNKADRAADQTNITKAKTGGGGFLSFSRRGNSNVRKQSKISVSSAKSASTTDLAAQITGSVEIQFKSDYFKLDNFAQLYGGGSPQTPPPPQNQIAPGA